jgi:predicted component of type VI protein secretion system
MGGTAIHTEVTALRRELSRALERLGNADETGHTVADLETLLRVIDRECCRILDTRSVSLGVGDD